MTFEADVRAQGEALRSAVDAHLLGGETLARSVERLASDAPRIFVSGMGSSISAAELAVQRIAEQRPAELAEAGELLHYGMGRIERGSLVVLVSQSGRSAETLELGRQLRTTNAANLIAVTNEIASPVASLSDIVVPIHAGVESAVATKTFMNTFIALQLLADIITADSSPYVTGTLGATLGSAIDSIAVSNDRAQQAAQMLLDCSSLVIVGRGPALASARYGALIVAETAATHAEAMPGGSFRHGPLEMVGTGLGVIILAPTGPTRELAIRLALETSANGSPTWLIGDVAEIGNNPFLLVSSLPPVREPLWTLPLVVPLQQFASALAVLKGRVPGVLLSATKVTEVQ